MTKWIAIAILLVPMLARAQLSPLAPTSLGIEDIAGMINRECIKYEILGPCLVPILAATHVTVTYWEPVLMIETYPRSGQSILGEGVFDFLTEIVGSGTEILTSIATGAADAAGASLSGVWSGGGGARTTSKPGTSNLHFVEARVYTIPSLIGLTCGACPQSDTTFSVNYISDADVLWRYAQPRLSAEDPVLGTGPLGVWAKLNPRVGFLSHSSNHVAGAAAAGRAAWIAFDPAGSLAIPPDPRIVVNPTSVLPTCWQLGYPKRAFGTLPNECLRIGAHPGYWDRTLITLDSAMLHFIYAKRECCVDTGNSICGLALGAGGAQNWCELPLAPGGLIPNRPLPAPTPIGTLVPGG